MKRYPTNVKLWKKVQKLTKGSVKYIIVDDKRITGPRDGKGFKKHPSAYSNSWACKLYKQLGGGWKNYKVAVIASRIADLKQWHEEEWVAIDTKGNIVGPCAQSEERPKETKGGKEPLRCLPKAKALGMSPKERAMSSRAKKRVQKKSPSTKPVHVPNP